MSNVMEMESTLKERIDRLCLERIGRKPDLENPQGYNDKIQWLKLYDQMPEHITCCDKIQMKDYVAKAIGERFIVKTISAADKFEGLNFKDHHFNVVVKCNHDSGSVRFLRTMAEKESIRAAINQALGKVYGIEKGEWAYQFIKPMAMLEEEIPGHPIDYKFHCCNGKVKWVQIISGRFSGRKPKEVITNIQGEILPLHMDHKMEHCQELPKGFRMDNWDKMLGAASRLSEKFRYVRVDMYEWLWSVYVGELTFWPLAGCYKTKNEPEFGKLLDFDMKERRQPILE